MKRVLSWLTGSQSNGRLTLGRANSFRPTFESLESRRTLNGDQALAFMDQGALVIEGTDFADEVRVFYAPPGTQMGGGIGGVYTEGIYVVEARIRGGHSTSYWTFNANQTKAIVFNGNGGDDQFRNQTNVSLLAHGGPGNDTIYGGLNGMAQIYGDSGNDTLIGTTAGNIIEGGPENDVIFGLEGSDVLFGNAGDDDLHGYEGHDLLFGGRGTDALAGGDGMDLLEGGKDLYSDILSGEYLDGIADHSSDLFSIHDGESERDSASFLL